MYTSKSNDGTRLPTGLLYPGNVSGYLTSGKQSYIAQIPVYKVDAVNATPHSLQDRAQYDLELLKHVSSSSEAQNESNLRALLVEMMKQQSKLFQECAETAGISTNSKQLTPESAVELQSLLRITNNKFDELRTILKNQNVDILPSNRQMKKVSCFIFHSNNLLGLDC